MGDVGSHRSEEAVKKPTSISPLRRSELLQGRASLREGGPYLVETAVE
jgi:hypothetical protein